MSDLNELVYDVIKSKFTEHGWTIPVGLLNIVTGSVCEAVGNLYSAEEMDQEYQDALETIEDHEDRIAAIERQLAEAQRGVSRPKKLRRPSRTTETVELPEISPYDLAAARLLESSMNSFPQDSVEKPEGCIDEEPEPRKVPATLHDKFERCGYTVHRIDHPTHEDNDMVRVSKDGSHAYLLLSEYEDLGTDEEFTERAEKILGSSPKDTFFAESEEDAEPGQLVTSWEA